MRAVNKSASFSHTHNWRSTTLGELISLRRGHDLTWRQRGTGHVPVMGSAGQNGFHSEAIARGPGVVLGRSGASFGQAYYCEVDFWPHNTALYVTDFHGNNPKFIYYLLSSIDFKGHNSGGAQQSLNRNFIAPISLSVPSPREQIQIAEALDNSANMIKTLERVIVKKQAIKQSLMQQLLTGQTRLPGFTKPWRKVALGKLATIISGGTPKSSVPAYWDGGIPWCTPTDITGEASRFLTRTERTISREGLDKSAAQLLPEGSLLLCTRATIGEARIAKTPIATNQGFKSLVPHSDVSVDFLYYKILSIKDTLASKGTGSTFLEISKRDVSDIEVQTPEFTEQKSISLVISDVDDEIDHLKRRLAKAQDIKQGMMQELLSGRTRLPVKEGSV
ncbi:restriction endonuclease subunit S [Nocardiopsis dassonvillei]|uniref:restriction endonuclease subunit S n=1 Tax=Nocardiopsis dassonvillei TaxID=2014 RepID=UPI00157CBB4D|nr:restriction endonuclease subunit S [Nocardiopsis dassonvillei]